MDNLPIHNDKAERPAKPVRSSARFGAFGINSDRENPDVSELSQWELNPYLVFRQKTALSIELRDHIYFGSFATSEIDGGCGIFQKVSN
jgi:hypothetical protein